MPGRGGSLLLPRGPLLSARRWGLIRDACSERSAGEVDGGRPVSGLFLERCAEQRVIRAEGWGAAARAKSLAAWIGLSTRLSGTGGVWSLSVDLQGTLKQFSPPVHASRLRLHPATARGILSQPAGDLEVSSSVQQCSNPRKHKEMSQLSDIFRDRSIFTD